MTTFTLVSLILASILLLVVVDSASGRNHGTPFFRRVVVSTTPPRGGAASSTSVNDRQRVSNKPDRFVQAAPLMLGVKCCDGVVLLAAHTLDDEEPLLYYYPTASSQDELSTAAASTMILNETWNGTTKGSEGDETPQRTNATTCFRDLPSHYAGPFRIQVVDPQNSVTLVSTGWRADCEALVRKARALASRERTRYGPTLAEETGMVVSQDLSLYLARCAVSDNTRTKSCVGLLATPSRLWLIDATGAIPVRALCIGGGTLSGSSSMTTSDAVNQKLMEITNWTVIDCEKALQQLLRLLENPQGDNDPLIRRGTRVEIAFVRRDRMMRRRLETLMSMTEPFKS